MPFMAKDIYGTREFLPPRLAQQPIRHLFGLWQHIWHGRVAWVGLVPLMGAEILIISLMTIQKNIANIHSSVDHGTFNISVCVILFLRNYVYHTYIHIYIYMIDRICIEYYRIMHRCSSIFCWLFFKPPRNKESDLVPSTQLSHELLMDATSCP